MLNTIKKSALPAVAILGGVMAAPAQAALVNTWAYTVSSTFVNSVFEAEGTGTPRTNNAGTVVSWGPTNGSTAQRSAIGARNTPISGEINTNGDFEAANDYFHRNNTLPTGTKSLLSTTLRININLTPIDPAGVAASPILTTFDINFIETDNNAPICANGEANGSGINSNGCADIFTLDFTDGAFEFNYDNVNYTLFLFEDPNTTPRLGTLTDAACAAAGAASGCFGFLTRESAETVAEFVIAIEAQDVPEPAMFGLLGLGVLGIAASRRRRA